MYKYFALIRYYITIVLSYYDQILIMFNLFPGNKSLKTKQVDYSSSPPDPYVD